MSDLSEAIERLTQSIEACGGSGSPYLQLPKGLYYLDVTAVCEAAGAEKADAAIRRRDDVIAEMGNRIAELEAEKETREYVGPIELAPHVWAESDEAIAKLEAERRS